MMQRDRTQVMLRSEIEHIIVQPTLADRILKWIRTANDEQISTLIDQMIGAIEFDPKSKWSKALNAAELHRWISIANPDSLYEVIDEVIDWFSLETFEQFLVYVID